MAKCVNAFNAIKRHDLSTGKIIGKRSAYATESMGVIIKNWFKTEWSDGDEIIQARNVRRRG